MLCVDVSINRELRVGEIFIRRVGVVNEKEKLYEYKVIRPKGAWSQVTICHFYKEGWFDLLVRVFNLLKKYGYSTPYTEA